MGIFHSEKAGPALQVCVLLLKDRTEMGVCFGVSMRTCCCRHMLRAEVHDLVLPSLVQTKADSQGRDLCTRS